MNNNLKKQIETEIEIPQVPNFLRFGERKTLPLWQFTEEELRDIGAEWTENLIARAKEQHRNHE